MKLINKIRTSPAVVELIYALTVFFGAIGRVFRRPSHEETRSMYPSGAPVSGQGLMPLASLPVGRYDMDRSGCAVIAAYNVLCLLGENASLAEAARYFERRGMIFSGALGVHPHAVRSYLKRHGYDTATLYSRAISDENAVNGALAPGGAAVFTFWNSRRLKDNTGHWEGAHTVALTRDESGIIVYNAHNTAPEPLRFDSVGDYIAREGLLPIVMYCVKS